MKGNKALPLTITLGSLLIVFTLALTTLWNIVLIYNSLKLKEHIPTGEVWQQWVILGVGSFLFVVIIVGITLFVIFMSRQIMLNQLQKNFIDAVTHELKTPITSLRLYVETLQRHTLPPEKRQNFLQVMLKDLDHLDTLVTHVLESARVEYRQREADFETLHLRELVQECAGIIQRRYPEVQSTITISEAAVVTRSNPYALRLILLNVLDNAVKYSPESPCIDIQIQQRAQDIFIEISDQGVGIPAGEHKRIFKRFYRSKLSENAKGTGLGLFIVSETLKQLKGSIRLQSEVGQGSTFTLRLPYRAP